MIDHLYMTMIEVHGNFRNLDHLVKSKIFCHIAGVSNWTVYQCSHSPCHEGVSEIIKFSSQRCQHSAHLAPRNYIAPVRVSLILPPEQGAKL